MNKILTCNPAYGQVSPIKLQREVNDTIIPGLGLDLGKATISENCARHWLKRLGYELTTAKKGIYVDGHERPDVVDYRKTFLNAVAEDEHLRNMYEDKDLEIVQPALNPGTEEHKHIPVHHDESIFRSNELQQRIWVTDGKMPLRKKGQGKATHVSDFITEETGRLSLSQEQVGHFRLLCLWFIYLFCRLLMTKCCPKMNALRPMMLDGSFILVKMWMVGGQAIC